MKYKLSKDVELFIEKEGGVLYDKISEHFFGIDFVGCLICEEIQKGTDFESIVLCLSKRFGVDIDVISRDVGEFIANMMEKALVCQEK